MNIGFFKELKKYSIREIGEKLKINDPEEKSGVIRKLKECQILKAVRKDSADLNFLLNSDIVPGDTIDDSVVYEFDYVGIIVFNNYVINCFPKYFEEEPDGQTVDSNLQAKFKQVIQVIEKYNRKKRKNNYRFNLTDGRGGEITNEIGLKVFLLREFYQRGLYKKDREVIEDNGAGEILWEETLEQPGFFKNGKVFHVPLKTLLIEEDDNYFTELHRCILTDISQDFSKQGLCDVFNIAPVFLSNVSLERFDNSVEHIKYMLKRELKVQFVTWKQNLLRALYTYVEVAKTERTTDHVELFGTNCFYLIWEDVCKTILHDKLNEPLKNLPDCNFKLDKKLSDVIMRPVWKNEKGDKADCPSDTFKPDIIGIFEKKLIIFDAKYYCCEFNDGKIKNQPGVEDIAKQYLYELAFTDFADSNPYNITHNVFLFPGDKETVLTGNANIKFLKRLKEIKVKEIKAVKLRAETAYDIYLNDSGENGNKVSNLVREELIKAEIEL